MTDEELQIEANAVAFVRTHKKELIQKFAPPEVCYPVDAPASLFMAGSPGAGKTEVSKRLVLKFTDVPVRIDADEIRAECPGYTGDNAYVFQKAATRGVHELYTHALSNNLNCIIDGTFGYEAAEENVMRSLKRGRLVEIWFVYQDPLTAWEFTKVREKIEKRNVPKEAFIRGFIRSRENVAAVKKHFGKEIELNLLIKDYKTEREELHLNIQDAELDHYIGRGYSVDELQQILL